MYEALAKAISDVGLGLGDVRVDSAYVVMLMPYNRNKSKNSPKIIA